MKCVFCIDCDAPCFDDRCKKCAYKLKKRQERAARANEVTGTIEKIKEGECYLYRDKLSEKLEEQGLKYYNVSKYS
jgi:hypothetical protein